MKISYNWLQEYLPEKIEPAKLSEILTSIGLEVESLERYEEIKGGLEGLLIGEVLECIKHPGADKLKLTKVLLGNGERLQIVCGATNVAAGQKVIVATAGTTIYPVKGEPVTMKNAKIRGIESQGMICSEDEIGIGNNHEGIIVLPHDVKIDSTLSSLYEPYSDWIFEIGITPNRMDAMSHLGVAKDVCAYLSQHNKKEYNVNLPFKNSFKTDNHTLAIEVKIENTEACQRYSGVSIANITVGKSPKWMQQKLKSISIRPINNIVDTTNYVLHETGQPLHAFDANEIKGKKIIVENLPGGTRFIGLDEKERKLHYEDLMICNGDEEPMCFGGVFGGIKSGVTEKTRNIFLESAWFSPKVIRRTSQRHGLRTDASIRFEKGVDISNTVRVLKRAAALIQEIAGGEIASDVIDIYPSPKQKSEIVLKNHVLKKLSGKNYHADAVKNILKNLDFEIIKEGQDDLHVAVPFSKPDITLPVDVIEEVMRIDGYNNIEIPSAITISPAIETHGFDFSLKEKVSDYLTGLGFTEIITNSITNNAYFKQEELSESVMLLNNLSVELNVMRPSLLETGLERVAYNLNHKNNDLLFFEFGKSYSTSGVGEYDEEEHLCLYVSGNSGAGGWRQKESKADLYYLKGVVEKIFQVAGLQPDFRVIETSIHILIHEEFFGKIEQVSIDKAEQFNIKQQVFFGDILWKKFTSSSKEIKLQFTEIPKYPKVERDLSIIVNKNVQYTNVEGVINKIRMDKLVSFKLFDIFESDRLGSEKKSLAISFTFSSKEKTLSDNEIDAMMNKIASALQKELNAEIRNS